MSNLIYRALLGPLAIGLSMNLAGCLGGGSDSTSSTGDSGSSTGGSGISGFTVTVEGVAMAGPISGTVCAYSLSSAGAVGNQLACTQTNAATGAYSLAIQNYVGNVLLKAWGTYTDEATGQTMTISQANALRSVNGWDTAENQTWPAAITPITEALIRAAGDTLTDASFDAAAAKLGSALGVPADEIYDTFIAAQPVQGNIYREMLNHWSQAQKTYCSSSGAPAGCDLDAHLAYVSNLLNTNASLLGEQINAAKQAWENANPGGGNSSSGGTTSPGISDSLTLDYLLPQSFGEVKSVDNGRYTIVERDEQGNITHEFVLFADSEGLKLSKETWWVKATDWEDRGSLHAGSPGAVKQEMIWDVPTMLAKAGMKVGDTHTFTTNERLLVYTNTPQTAHTNRCGGNNWNVVSNQGKGETNPYRWEPIVQTVTLTVEKKENVTHNGQTVSAFVVKYSVRETNVPFSVTCTHITNEFGVRFWFAKDIGLVKTENL